MQGRPGDPLTRQDHVQPEGFVGAAATGRPPTRQEVQAVPFVQSTGLLPLNLTLKQVFFIQERSLTDVYYKYNTYNNNCKCKL